MTSDSAQSPLKPQPGVLEIAPYVGGEAGLKNLRRAVKLSANESPLGPSPKAIDAYQALAADLHRYPDGGAHALRQAIGDLYGIDADRIVCGNGSDNLLELLTYAYAGPGDEVLYSEHGFLMYPISALSAGATPVKAPETEDLRADIDALLARVTSRTKILFLANPNNPTGTYNTGDELRRLRRELPDHVLLVVDAAYAEYVSNNDYENGQLLVDESMQEAHGGNVVMTRTFSKIYGLGGIRLGWCYCPPAVADVLNRVRGPFNVSAPALAAGLAAVQDTAHTDAARNHNDEWRPWLEREIAALGLHVVPSVGNFILILFPDGADQANAADAALKEQGLVLRQMGGYGFPEGLRLTVGTAEENREVVAALKDFMS